MKTINYRIVRARDLVDLEQQVDQKLAAGWELYGSLAVHSREGQATIYYQPITLVTYQADLRYEKG